jgi:hypothetical protein
MSGTPGRSIVDLADEVIHTDVSAQERYAVWTKGTTAIPLAPARRGLLSILVATALILVVGAGGVVTGVVLFGGQPAPSLIAQAGATPGPSPSEPLVSELPQSIRPETQPPLSASLPTPSPTATPSEPAPEVVTPLDSLAGLIDLSFLLKAPDELNPPGTPDLSEEPVDSPAYANLTALALAHANLSRGDLAALGDFAAEPNSVAIIGEQFACTEPNVFCGAPTLDPGGYYFVGFATLGPPPTSGTDQIYSVYYLLTDLDGDWSNNAYTSPPLTDLPFNSLQYQIEGGWYGTTKGLGETDIDGPAGPDGQSPRFNQVPGSRLVLTQDPPGGFFIVPDRLMGPWFRLSLYWQDFNQQGVLSLDNVSLGTRIGLLPSRGPSAAPAVLSCVRVDAVDSSLDGQPASLDIYLRPAAGPLAQGTLLDIALSINGAAAEDHAGLTLEPTGDGTYVAHVGVPVDSALGFSRVGLAPPGSASIDASVDFFVLAGTGINLPSGYAGLALGDPACGG